MNEEMTKKLVKKKFKLPLIEVGQLLVLINIVSNILIHREMKVQWLVYPAIPFFVFILILWPLPIYTLRKYGQISQNGSFLATTRVVDRGIYGIIRHPQYLGLILLNMALMLLKQDWITIIISVISSLFLIFGIKEEEDILVEQFGKPYADYCKRVPVFNIFKGLIIKVRKK